MQLSGTALAVALAGCAGNGGGDADTTTETTDGAGTTETTTTADGTTETTDGTTTSAGDGGYLRAVHASPNAPDVDVYVDDQLAFEGAPFGGVTPYASLSPGDHDVRITAAGDESTVVFDQTVPVAEGFQSAVAYGELQTGGGTTTADGTTTANGTTTEQMDGDTAFTVGLLEDQSEAPGADESVVRLFHASPDAPAVDVTVESSGSALFDGVAFGESSSYETVPAGSYTLEVRPDTEDNSGDVVTTFDVTVEGGTAYTAFAVGYLADQEPGFDLVTAVDGRTGESES
ncbi:DUF4397 domain-containing protein [Halobacterium litoreum]|uniref:DUF4397 domain-containing protein n=1 Tax=Halobacterium litoreum TaxID=2039234 RepID=A0ABD5NG50_9EURY|nr:DUF4397 domain-containing protein [Halobacterium litoreum]UHH13031.1 DUF4397 domain-containing protein [Halobacterium litoreum]